MTIDPSTLLETLRDVPLFASLKPEETFSSSPSESIPEGSAESPAGSESGTSGGGGLFALSSASEVSHPRGIVLLRANDPSPFIGIVREGGVKETQTTPEGKEVILALHGPGDLFGEVLFGEDEAPTTVTTILRSRILMIPRADWNHMLETHPAVERSLLTLMGRRLSEAWQVIRMLSRYTTEARLRSALLLLTERWGRSTPDGTEIALDLTHRTLADITGASREKVTRAIGILQQKGVVQVIRRRIVIPSVERLLAQ